MNFRFGTFDIILRNQNFNENNAFLEIKKNITRIFDIYIYHRIKQCKND